MTLMKTLIAAMLVALSATTSFARENCSDIFATNDTVARHESTPRSPLANELRTAIQSYNPGKNNRVFLMKVVQSIGEIMGVDAKIGFGAASVETSPSLSASPGKIHIPERHLERLMAYGQTPEEKLSILSFVVAHELAHIALKHPELHLYVHGLSSSAPPEIQLATQTRAKISQAMETRADRIAARVVNDLLALDPTPIVRMFEATRDNHGGDGYPSAEERIGFVTHRGDSPGSFDRQPVNEGALLDQLLKRLL